MADTMIHPEEPDNIGYVTSLSCKRRHPLYHTGLFGGVNPLGQHLEHLSFTGAIHFTAILPRVPNRHAARAKQA